MDWKGLLGTLGDALCGVLVRLVLQSVRFPFYFLYHLIKLVTNSFLFIFYRPVKLVAKLFTAFWMKKKTLARIVELRTVKGHRPLPFQKHSFYTKPISKPEKKKNKITRRHLLASRDQVDTTATHTQVDGPVFARIFGHPNKTSSCTGLLA